MPHDYEWQAEQYRLGRCANCATSSLQRAIERVKVRMSEYEKGCKVLIAWDNHYECSDCARIEAANEILQDLEGLATSGDELIHTQPLDPAIAQALNEDFGELYEPITPAPALVGEPQPEMVFDATKSLERTGHPRPAPVPQSLRVCGKCGHRATINGVCQVGTGTKHPITGYKAICGCRCTFPELVAEG